MGIGLLSHLENLSGSRGYLVGAGEVLIPASYRSVDGAVHAISLWKQFLQTPAQIPPYLRKMRSYRVTADLVSFCNSQCYPLTKFPLTCSISCLSASILHNLETLKFHLGFSRRILMIMIAQGLARENCTIPQCEIIICPCS